MRHPASFPNDVQKDSSLGYDWSSHWVNVHTTVVTDANGNQSARIVDPATGNLVLDKGGIRRDFDYANEIYAQAGLQILQPSSEWAGDQNYNGVNNPAVTFPINSLAQNDPTNEAKNVAFSSRSIHPTGPNDYSVVNLYYVHDFDPVIVNPETSYTVHGLALAPNLAYVPGGFDGVLLADQRDAGVTAHEIGHMLLESNGSGALYSIGAGSHPFQGHSVIQDNLMAAGTGRKAPSGLFGPTKSGKTVAVDLAISAPAEPGRANGNIGTTDHLNDVGYFDSNSNGIQDQGEDTVGQIEAIYTSPFVRKPTQNFVGLGDRADFLWVEDNKYLENIPGADDTISPQWLGGDYLTWSIGDLAPEPALPFDRGNWLDDTSNLPNGRFNSAWFNRVDVISMVARYTDMDVDDNGDWSAAKSALDYTVQFSATGGLDDSEWVSGVLEKTFDDGWTLASKAEDYVGRWKAPIGFQAQYVRIRAANNDGNA